MAYITSILTFAPYFKPNSIKEGSKYSNGIPSCKKYSSPLSFSLPLVYFILEENLRLFHQPGIFMRHKSDMITGITPEAKKS
jgi:hypothetical protein